MSLWNPNDKGYETPSTAGKTLTGDWYSTQPHFKMYPIPSDLLDSQERPPLKLYTEKQDITGRNWSVHTSAFILNAHTRREKEPRSDLKPTGQHQDSPRP